MSLTPSNESLKVKKHPSVIKPRDVSKLKTTLNYLHNFLTLITPQFLFLF